VGRRRAVTRIDYALIIASVMLAATGQVLMKLGMSAVGSGGFAATIATGFAQPVVLLGLACYAASTVSWLIVLSRVPLSVAYPFGALSYVAVVLVALATGEHVSGLRWLGVALIVGGIWLVSGRSDVSRA
jgi:drug/metabolite transporter (DMT)-like permease